MFVTVRKVLAVFDECTGQCSEIQSYRDDERMKKIKSVDV